MLSILCQVSSVRLAAKVMVDMQVVGAPVHAMKIKSKPHSFLKTDVKALARKRRNPERHTAYNADAK